MSSETRLLHEAGCTPKPKLQLNQIKKEGERGGVVVEGFRLPICLPIGKVKLENEKKNQLKLF